MINKPKDQLEADLWAKQDIVIRAAEATHHLAATLLAVHQSFWHHAPERVLAVLNTDVATTIETFQANTALGHAVNASLVAVDHPRFATRAPVEMPNGYSFDGTAFLHSPTVKDV